MIASTFPDEDDEDTEFERFDSHWEDTETQDEKMMDNNAT